MQEENQVYTAADIKQAISPTLPPCENCESKNVIAVRRTDILYAVTACIDCNHRRQLTEDEYRNEWPDSGADPMKENESHA